MATCSKSEITDLDMCRAVRSAADKYVLWFQVTMDNIIQSMNVNQAFKDLSEKAPDLWCIFVQILLDEITKCLSPVSDVCGAMYVDSFGTYPLLTILHENVQHISKWLVVAGPFRR
jgi:hypothetical protein